MRMRRNTRQTASKQRMPGGATALRKRRITARNKRRPASTANGSRNWSAVGMIDAAKWLELRGEPQCTSIAAKQALHRMWSERFYNSYGNAGMGKAWKRLIASGMQYAAGFMRHCGFDMSVVPVPLRGTAAAIVCTKCWNGELRGVLTELDALPLREIIVMIYGCSELKEKPAVIHPTARFIFLPEVADPDVGRAIGARLADADTLLFVSSERPAAASVLARYLWECDGRADVAISDLPLRNIVFRDRGSIAQLQEFLNASLNRPDLKSNSLTTLPYALSRRALDTIGADTLCVPAKAHAVAILSKLRIVTGGSAAERPGKRRGEPVDRIAAGDHAEAWHTAIAVRGNRLKRPDLYRNRHVLDGLDPGSSTNNGEVLS